MGWTLQDGRKIADDPTHTEYAGLVYIPHRNAERLAESAPGHLHGMIVAAGTEWFVQRFEGGYLIGDCYRSDWRIGDPQNVRVATSEQVDLIDRLSIGGITAYYDLRHPETEFTKPLK